MIDVWQAPKFTSTLIWAKVFYKKGVLKNFTKFTGKHLCQRLFLNKVAALSPATLSKKRFLHRCSPVSFVKFLSTPLFMEHLSLDEMLLYKTYGCSQMFRFTLNHELFLKAADIDNFLKNSWKLEFPQRYSHANYIITNIWSLQHK